MGFDKAVVSPCPTYIVLKLLEVDKIIDKYFKVGIVPSFGHTASYLHFLPQIVELIRGVVDLVGDENVSIICHDRHDYNFASDIFASRKINICLPDSFSQVKYEYSKCEKVLSLRGHGLIFSAACGIPCSVVALNIKMDTLFDFHYGVKSLGLNFSPNDHLYFLKSMIRPKNIDLLSKVNILG